MTKDEIDNIVADIAEHNRIGDLVGDFSWNFSMLFFIETSEGNFIWADPEYNGSNIIIEYNGSFDDWLVEENIPYARSKGSHRIKDYCGNDFKFVPKSKFIEYKFQKDGCMDKNEANIDWNEFVNIFYDGDERAANIEYLVFANQEN